MTYKWTKPEPSDGGYMGQGVFAPNSDWWLRNLENELKSLDERTVSIPPAFEAQQHSGKPRPGKDEPEFNAPLPTCHPREIAPLKPDSSCYPDKNSVGPRDDTSTASFATGDVIIGIIDDGIAIANSRFLKVGKNGKPATRIKYFWNQDANCDVGKCKDKKCRVPFGREWNEAGLNLAMFSSNPAGNDADETRAYRMTEMDRVLRGAASHGSHVMDLATGYDFLSTNPDGYGEKGADLSAKRPIIAVQLARFATAESSGAYMASYVTHALAYVLKRAWEMQKDWQVKVPIVVNFSYGIFSGGHNGWHQVEEWIDNAVEYMRSTYKIPVSIVVPSGNSLLSRTHAKFDFAKEKYAAEFSLRVNPANKAPTFLELWLPERDYDGKKPEKYAMPCESGQVSVELRPPLALQYLGRNCGFPATGQSQDLIDSNNLRVARVYHELIVSERKNGQGGSQLRCREKLTVAISPTQFEQPTNEPDFRQKKHLAPSGDWGVKFTYTSSNRSFDPVTAEIWIQRNDTPFGFRPFGRQSYLVDAKDYPYNGDGRPVESDDSGTIGTLPRRAGTLNGIGTGESTIRVGSYRVNNVERAQRGDPRNKDLLASRFSSAADKCSPYSSFQSVDVAAASEESHALPGVKGSGVWSGSRFRFAGTSSSVPQIARYIALQYDKQLKWKGTRAEIVQTAGCDSCGQQVDFLKSTQPERTGSGLLRLRETRTRR